MLDRGHQRFPHRGIFPAVVVVLVVGVALSALLYASLRRWERDREQLTLASTMGTVSKSIEHCLRDQYLGGQILATLYEMQAGHVSAGEFHGLARPVRTQCASLEGIAWAPRVPHAERAAFEARMAREPGGAGFKILSYDEAGRLMPAPVRREYYPIEHIEPEPNAFRRLGFDVASRPADGVAIERAVATGKPAFSAHELRVDPARRVLEVVVVPVFSAAEADSEAQPTGVVLGISAIPKIVDEALAQVGWPPVHVYVYDAPPGRDELLYIRPASGQNEESGKSGKSMRTAPAEPPPRSSRTDVELGDHRLAVVLTPAGGGDPLFTRWLPPAASTAALLTTVLLAAFLQVREASRRQLRDLAARLSEADKRKDEFIAMLGHELRNPITPLSNLVYVLKRTREPTGEKLNWAMDVMERQVTHLTRIVDDLLDVARITSGRLHLQKSRVELAGVVRQAIEATAPFIEARRHKLALSLPDDPLWTEGDRARLVQVVINLLNNSAKFTNEGGSIDVRVRRDGDHAMLVVTDNGTGIAPELLPHVFEPFRQGARPSQGLGIGLSLSRQIVELHGGQIQAESAGLGRGSTFTVMLPLSHDESHDVSHDAPKREVRPRQEAGVAARRLLVVDDNLDVAQSFASILELLGHEVQTTFDGPHALAQAATFEPHLAFIDIGLPGMDGYEVARRLREQLGTKIRLVAVTGYGQRHDRERARRAGYDDLIVKPPTIDAVKKVLAQAGLSDAAHGASSA